MKPFMHDPEMLRKHVMEKLAQGMLRQMVSAPETEASPLNNTSAVLLGLMRSVNAGQQRNMICLVLNKRSARVRQPGDLCYPGGGIWNFDRIIAGIQRLPSSHIDRWTRRSGRQNDRREKRRLALLWTTCLRESWEEMRLNPLRVSLLGLLPNQDLVMFKHTIHPMVGWIRYRTKFRPNWEVDRIVPIPLVQLLDPSNYGCYRLTWPISSRRPPPGTDHPCFIFRDPQHGVDEILWGATYRITMSFLAFCFGFTPPSHSDMPVVERHLDEDYFKGR